MLVTMRDVPATPVDIVEHRGDPATLGATIQRFIAWRKTAGLHPRREPTVISGAPSGVPRRLPIIESTLVSGRPVGANGEQINTGEIAGGRCAVLRTSATPTISSLPHTRLGYQILLLCPRRDQMGRR